jgi:hypothetical protein
MELKFNTHDICLAIVYKNGQTNVYDNLIKPSDAEDEEKLTRALNKLNKKQNYFPKKMQVVKAVLFVEE